MAKIKCLINKAVDCADMTAIKAKNAVTIAIKDKTEGFDTMAFGVAVGGLVICAVLLMIFIGSGKGDDDSILGIFKKKIVGTLNSMFSKSDSVLG